LKHAVAAPTEPSAHLPISRAQEPGAKTATPTSVSGGGCADAGARGARIATFVVGGAIALAGSSALDGRGSLAVSLSGVARERAWGEGRRTSHARPIARSATTQATATRIGSRRRTSHLAVRSIRANVDGGDWGSAHDGRDEAGSVRALTPTSYGAYVVHALPQKVTFVEVAPPRGTR
jgi:hypothetical protein